MGARLVHRATREDVARFRVTLALAKRCSRFRAFQLAALRAFELTRLYVTETSRQVSAEARGITESLAIAADLDNSRPIAGRDTAPLVQVSDSRMISASHARCDSGMSRVVDRQFPITIRSRTIADHYGRSNPCGPRHHSVRRWRPASRCQARPLRVMYAAKTQVRALRMAGRGLLGVQTMVVKAGLTV